MQAFRDEDTDLRVGESSGGNKRVKKGEVPNTADGGSKKRRRISSEDEDDEAEGDQQEGVDTTAS